VKLPAYPQYKTSSVAWLGDVPQHWEVKRSDALVTTERRQVSPEAFADREVFHYSIPVVQENGTGGIEDGTTIASAKQLITEPVLLVSKLNPRKATICLAKPVIGTLTVCSTEFVALRAERCEIRFLQYLTLSEFFRQRLDSVVQSVTRSHQRANPEQIYRFWAAWPEIPEQQAIANFLDVETAKLDTLVAKKRKLVEKLKEKRTALISRAVTRGLPPEAARAGGLNPNPKLKPSGIEWLGDIPEHWEVVRIGRKITLQRGVDITKDEQKEGSVPVVSSGGISSFHDTALANGPGVVVGRKGTAGAVYYIETDFWPHDTTLWVREFGNSFPKYVYYKLCSMDLESFDTGSSNPTVNRNLIHPVLVTWPPAGEQRAIVAYLDRDTGKIDRMVAKVEEAIERLQEYRTALITAAVTGKIYVRESVA
jgi:type I restriction enzyme, S subunit